MNTNNNKGLKQIFHINNKHNLECKKNTKKNKKFKHFFGKILQIHDNYLVVIVNKTEYGIFYKDEEDSQMCPWKFQYNLIDEFPFVLIKKNNYSKKISETLTVDSFWVLDQWKYRKKNIKNDNAKFYNLLQNLKFKLNCKITEDERPETIDFDDLAHKLETINDESKKAKKIEKL